MPLYKVALKMAHDATWPRRQKWSTTFIVNASGAATAADVVLQGWIDHLRAGTAQTVFAYEVYASSLVEGDDDYFVLPIPAGQQRGTSTQAPAGQEKYEPTVCATVTIRASAGRPSRKFWRFGFAENHISGGVTIDVPTQEQIETAFNGFLTSAGGALVDPDGQALLTPVAIKLGKRKLGRLAGLDLPLPPAVG